MDDVSMLLLYLESTIMSQGHQVRLTIGSDSLTRVAGPLEFSLINRVGDVINTFTDDGLIQDERLASVFPVPSNIPNGMYSLHVNAPSMSEEGSLDINILDEVSVSRWERFFEAARNAAIRESDDAFENMDRAAIEELAENYSETHHWDASAGVWSFLAYRAAACDRELAFRYCSHSVRDYLNIELNRRSPRTYFRDRSLTILAHLLPPGDLQEQTQVLLGRDNDSDPVDNSILFIDALLFLGIAELELASDLSRELGHPAEPSNVLQVLLMKWPMLCSIQVDREGASREPWYFRTTQARVRILPAQVLQVHVEATTYEDLLELVED